MQYDQDLPLAEQFRADPDGKYAKEMMAQLSQAAKVARARLTRAGPPSDFRSAERLAIAFETAQEVVQMVWAAENGRSLD